MRFALLLACACLMTTAMAQELVWERVGVRDAVSFGGRTQWMGDVDRDGWTDCIHTVLVGPSTTSLWVLSGCSVRACMRSPAAWSSAQLWASFSRAAIASAIDVDCDIASDLVLRGSARLGHGFVVDLANAPGPVGFAILVLGLQGVPRIDLAPLGAAGCALHMTPDFVLPEPTVQGAASANIGIPNSWLLVCTKVWAQWLPIDPQENRFGLTASNFGRALIGS